jgi:hypothetical protein
LVTKSVSDFRNVLAHGDDETHREAGEQDGHSNLRILFQLNLDSAVGSLGGAHIQHPLEQTNRLCLICARFKPGGGPPDTGGKESLPQEPPSEH